MTQLRKFVVNMKNLDQPIKDPIVAGAGDANGRTLCIFFSQEAYEQITSKTKLYLKWRHLQENVRGYNVFTKTSNGACGKPIVFEIKWPKAMLREGDVLCHIELVDDISIACSQNFTVHVLADPDDGSKFVTSDDYTVFQQAVIDMNSMSDNMQKQSDKWQQEFNDWKVDIKNITATANAAYQMASDTKEKLDTLIADGVGLYIEEFN